MCKVINQSSRVIFTPKSNCKRTIHKNTMWNADIGPHRMPSKKTHYIRQNFLNAIRQVSPLSKLFAQDDTRGHVMNLEDNGFVKKYTMRKVPKVYNCFQLCC